MTNITRAQIRHGILDEQLYRGTGYFVVTAALGRALTATTLGQGGDSMTKFNNRYIYTPASSAADQKRRVRDFDPLRRTLWHEGPDYASVPGVGATMELWAQDPDEVNAAITRALTRRCQLLQRTDIVTNGSSLYTIGTAPFDVFTGITEPDNQIFDVENVYGTDPTARIEPWDTGGKTFRGELDNGVLAVRFDPEPVGTVRVLWGEHYADLTTESATTTCPLRYVVWASLFELFTKLEERAINHAESQAQYGIMKASAEDHFMHEHTTALGTYAVRKKRIRRPRTFRNSPLHNLRGIGYGSGFYR